MRRSSTIVFPGMLSTFSIVACDARTGEVGIGVQSKFLSVGAVVPFVRAGAGAIATQAFANTRYGPKALDLLESGMPPERVAQALTADDDAREDRQFGIVDASGRAATFTGSRCIGWAGGVAGDDFAAQGNCLTGAAVVKSLAETFAQAAGALADRLIAALRAAQAAGGDKRGQQSAALIIEKRGGGYAGYNDRYVDLRVDDHLQPIEELARLLEKHKLYFFPAEPGDVLPIDDAVGAEIARELVRVGAIDRASGYDDRTRDALVTFMHVENLENRVRHDRTIDRQTLEYLRAMKRRSSSPVLLIGEHDVHELLPMGECIDVMQRAFAALDRAGYVQPVRSIAWQPPRNGAIAAMPAWMAQPPALGAKLVSVFPQNRQAGLDAHQGIVTLYDTQNGRLLAILHAGAVTAVRTAAVSGMATRMLANAHASNLAILGSGVQAHEHLRAMLEVRSIQSIRVWSRNADNARAFASEHERTHGVPVHVSRTVREAVADADIVCTATASTEAILYGKWLCTGAHVNAAGASVPGFRELDPQAVLRARVFVDSRESALAEADELRMPAVRIAGTLSELASGAVPGRTRADEITLFKSCGMAIEDLAAAHYVYERARASNRGTPVEF